MKFRNQIVLVGIVGAAFGVGRWTSTLEFSNRAVAQPEKAPWAAQPIDPTKMGIGAEHKVLDVLLGDWEATVKIWYAAGDEPMETKGKLHREWVLDGHFVHESVTAESMMPGGPLFHGMGVTGYNSDEKRYESGWVDNMSTWISTSTGTWDATKKSFTFSGEKPDGQGHRLKYRDVIDCSNPDRHLMKSWTTGADGKEFVSFDGVFERVKK